MMNIDASKARKIERRRLAADKAVRTLRVATNALNDYLHLCNIIADGNEVRRDDDCRVLLARNMTEQAEWLEERRGTKK